MNINDLTADKKDAILNVDSLLRIAGLPSYTEVVESRQRVLDSVARTDSTNAENDQLQRSLLIKAANHVRAGRTDNALAILTNLTV